MGYDIMMPSGFFVGFRETRTHSRTCDNRDNFIDIRVVSFLNSFSVFMSPMDIDYILVIVHHVYESEYLFLMKTNEYSTTKSTCG